MTNLLQRICLHPRGICALPFTLNQSIEDDSNRELPEPENEVFRERESQRQN